MHSSLQTPQVVISFAETIIQQVDFDQIEACYPPERIVKILQKTLEYLKHTNTITIPNNLFDVLKDKICELEIYVTDPVEGREINYEARGKDYATNILSYSSEMPESVINLLPIIPLGELVICHEVVVEQASEQGKTFTHHFTHLLVHGILHLLGFDHELGQAEQDEMENIEIAILAQLDIANPYE